MKKLTAMLLSLMMCFSLLAIPAHTILPPDSDGPGVIDAGGDLIDPGDEDPDEPGISAQSSKLPDPSEVPSAD